MSGSTKSTHTPSMNHTWSVPSSLHVSSIPGPMITLSGVVTWITLLSSRAGEHVMMSSPTHTYPKLTVPQVMSPSVAVDPTTPPMYTPSMYISRYCPTLVSSDVLLCHISSLVAAGTSPNVGVRGTPPNITPISLYVASWASQAACSTPCTIGHTPNVSYPLP